MKRNAVSRLQARIIVTDGPMPTPCWICTYALGSSGYPTLTAGGRTFLAHRFAYKSFVGPIPAGLELDHLCRNKRCCNPEHLEPVTHRENSIRAPGVKMDAFRADTCLKGHSLLDNPIRQPNGGRRCRVCKYETDRASRLRR